MTVEIELKIGRTIELLRVIFVMKRKEGMTHIRINGDYDVVGFFPQEKNSNMVIVLKERDKE